MTGWRAVVALALAFVGGYVLSSWLSLLKVDRLWHANRLLANTVHAQQEHIDYLEAGGDVVAEAENVLREPGS